MEHILSIYYFYMEHICSAFHGLPPTFSNPHKLGMKRHNKRARNEFGRYLLSINLIECFFCRISSRFQVKEVLET